jgi:hypothetical protein
MTERRKHVRYSPRVGVFAALGRGFTKVGKILNIGVGGLSLEYVAGQGITYDESIVDIFPENNLFHLYNLPCRIVYGLNLHVRAIDKYGFSLLISRQCGVEFVLGEDEIDCVKLFIMSHIA